MPAGRHAKAFPFLKMPPELRHQVYELVLLRPNKVSIKRRLKCIPGPLTRTSRLVRSESIPIFLKNQFKVTIGDSYTQVFEAWRSLFASYDTTKLDLEVRWVWP